MGGFVKSLSPDYPQVEVKTYTAGVDSEYIPKYGVLTASLLVINESVAVTDISKSNIRKAFKTAIELAEKE